MAFKRNSLAFVLVVCVTAIGGAAVSDPVGGAVSDPVGGPVTGSPLVVNQDGHIVVMEYEAWFGPNAMNFSPGTAMPLLQSADMVPYGGGYDSRDPAIIQQHVKWLEELGADAVLLDLTNDISCTFNSEWFVKEYLETTPGDCPVNRPFFKGIRDNTGNIYPAWQKLGTPIKIIPLVGGIDQDVLYQDQDGKTAFEKEIQYFGALMQEHPERQVIYDGKPLMAIYIGAGQDPSIADNPLWYQLRIFLKQHPALEKSFTFRMVAGYLDSQPELWTAKEQQRGAEGPVEIDPQYGFWSFVDRLKPACNESLCPYYPSYVKRGDRPENFTVSIATAGQDGWACPGTPPYCEDDALRWDRDRRYASFHSFMEYARRLDPIFLIVHQFNEFVAPDEGFDANTNDDIEPADEWGYSALKDVRREICLYHRQKSRLRDISVPELCPELP